MPRSIRTLPSPLTRAAKRFEKWRKTRTKPGIPAPLWRLATGLGLKYGVNKTATTLRLDYYDLKRRVESASGTPAAAATKAAFVEVVPATPAPTSECLVELENPRGMKMRIHLKVAGVAEIAALGQLWRQQG